MKPPEQDVENRIKVWQALSEFYLDNELTKDDLLGIANVCAKSSYSIAELDKIMFFEVWPAVSSNLAALGLGAVWTGWKDDYLIERILGMYQREQYLPWWSNPFKVLFSLAFKWHRTKRYIRAIRRTDKSSSNTSLNPDA